MQSRRRRAPDGRGWHLGSVGLSVERPRFDLASVGLVGLSAVEGSRRPPLLPVPDGPAEVSTCEVSVQS